MQGLITAPLVGALRQQQPQHVGRHSIAVRRRPGAILTTAMVKNRNIRDPYDTPLRDGNRDRLYGLLTERACATLLWYTFETNQVRPVPAYTRSDVLGWGR